MLFPKLKSAFNKSIGFAVETDLSSYRTHVDRIREIELKGIPDRLLRDKFQDLRNGARVPQILNRDPVAQLRAVFALVLEASRRALGLEPFDTQIIAGLAMAEGKVAELPTGEGKTLGAVFPACLRALSGRGVHILTFNDYLARRDSAWMGPIYERLGLTVGCVQAGMNPARKKEAYSHDVTYATAKEAGFDFLRDSIVYGNRDRVHRPFHAALVDEADSILIDEARIPLVIAGTGEPAAWGAERLAGLVRNLVPDKDFRTDAEHRNVFLTDDGAAGLERELGQGGLYEAGNTALLEAVHCALHAEALLRRDVDYIVREGRIDIVDEFTGRVVDDRHWPDGLQAAVEAKEGIGRGTRGRVLGSITLRHFFGLYPHLCGMTGTARSGAGELSEFYGLSTVVVPPHTPCVRADHPDAVYIDAEAKRRALIREIGRVHSSGRPILVGTASVKESESLAEALEREGIASRILNARNDELEAGIISRAGTLGAVTISTNMAGRGTDIKLGAGHPAERDRVADLGGLCVIGTNRHESLRIDGQLRGRAGRQGDPGSSRFFISFDDDIFVRYGLRAMFLKRHRPGPRQEPLGDRFVIKDIIHAQRIIEGQNFDIRRSLNKYSDLIERQRRIVQGWRDDILSGEDIQAEDESLSGIVRRNAPEVFAEGVRRFGPAAAEEVERRLTLLEIDRAWSDHLAWVTDTRESIHLMSLGGRSPLDEFIKSATGTFLEIRPRIFESVISGFGALAAARTDPGFNPDSLQGPTSTWTYLVNDDQFGWGMDLLKGGNIGFAAVAAGPAGALLMLWLLVKRLFKARTG
jgi:preprotein translocase subunit SecA